MDKEIRFKPLWRIHNSVYRRYRKGTGSKKIRKYVDRLLRVLRFRRG